MLQLERYSNLNKQVDAMSQIQPARNRIPAILIVRVDQKNEKTINFSLLQLEQFVEQMNSLKALKTSAKQKNSTFFAFSLIK